MDALGDGRDVSAPVGCAVAPCGYCLFGLLLVPVVVLDEGPGGRLIAESMAAGDHRASHDRASLVCGLSPARTPRGIAAADRDTAPSPVPGFCGHRAAAVLGVCGGCPCQRRAPRAGAAFLPGAGWGVRHRLSAA